MLQNMFSMILLHVIICIGKKKNNSIFYGYIYARALMPRKRSGRIQTNWKFSRGKGERVSRDFSFNDNVLIITRRIFTYYLANKKLI